MTTKKCFLCIGIGSVLIFHAIRQFNHTLNLLNKGVRTDAKVVNLIYKSRKGKSVYTPIFEYKNKEGNIVRFKYNVSTDPPAFKKGQEVGLVYSQETDEVKIESFWGLFRWSTIPLILASPLLTLGVSYISVSYTHLTLPTILLV